MATATDAVSSKLPTPPSAGKGPDDAGSIAAGFIAAFLFLGVILYLAVYFLRRYRRQRSPKRPNDADPPAQERPVHTGGHQTLGASDSLAEQPPAAEQSRTPEQPLAVERPSPLEQPPVIKPTPVAQLPYFAPSGPMFMMVPHPNLSGAQAWAEISTKTKGRSSEEEERPPTSSPLENPGQVRFSYGQWEKANFPRPMAGFRAPNYSGQSYEPFNGRRESPASTKTIASAMRELGSAATEETGQLE